MEYDVFLSHNSKDKHVVKTIAERLDKEAQLNVFFDDWNLIPGDPWQEDLEEAIDNSRTVAVFLGPSGISGWHNEEMRTALDKRVHDRNRRVIPVLLPGTKIPENDEIPSFLSRLTWVYFRNGVGDEHAFQRLVAGILGQSPGKGVEKKSSTDITLAKGEIQLFEKHLMPFLAPSPPSYFVPRNEINAKIKKELVGRKSKGALEVIALHGMGGVGKTTLLTALAQDQDIKDQFHDGILWVTLGQQPNILAHQTEWIRIFDQSISISSKDNAVYHLRTLLHDKACLLIIDDAWKAEHAQPFLVGNSKCKVIVTTRENSVIQDIGARTIEIDAFNENQALELFSNRLNELDKEQVKKALVLSEKLGYLPLAIELAAAQLGDGYGWDELINLYEKALQNYDDLEGSSAQIMRLRTSFKLSIDLLSPSDLEAFSWFGVLPEDAQINQTMAAALWDIDKVKAKNILRLFRNKALLKSEYLDEYRIHDLLHEEAKRLLSNRISLKEAHAHILNRYQSTLENNMWSSLENDGYIYKHLTWHMEQADKPEELHNLLVEETLDGKNAWFELCESSDLLPTYLADVARAWVQADRDIFIENKQESAITLQCQYALMYASVGSLFSNLSHQLLTTLLERRLISSSQAIYYASVIPDSSTRFRALIELTKLLSDLDTQLVLEQALILTRQLSSNDTKAYRLLELSCAASAQNGKMASML
jgi:hypothetical protein